MVKRVDRRSFIKRSSLGAMATPLLVKGKSPEDDHSGNETRIKAYRMLGRTGFNVSDISIGFPPNETVVKAGLKMGMNYIDTAEQYGNGNNERMIGKAIRDFDRKKIFLNTKIYAETGKYDKDDVIKKVRAACERLGTDYIDCMMLHAAENTRILKDESFHAAMDQMKAEGRVKYVGVSCHGSAWYLPPEEDLEAVLMTAVDDGRFDVFLMTYNFVNREKAERVLRACSDKNVGTTIMKSNPMITFRAIDGMISQMENESKRVDDTLRDWHTRLVDENNIAREMFGKMGYRDEDEELLKAAIRFVINNKDAHTVCLPFKNIGDMENWCSNSGMPLSQDQASLLDLYRKNFGNLNCRFGCRECAGACPQDVKVSDIMRFNYYFQNKGQEKYAMQRYAGLGKHRAEECIDCPGHCESACNHGVLARPLMVMAHENLSGNFA